MNSTMTKLIPKGRVYETLPCYTLVLQIPAIVEARHVSYGSAGCCGYQQYIPLTNRSGKTVGSDIHAESSVGGCVSRRITERQHSSVEHQRALLWLRHMVDPYLHQTSAVEPRYRGMCQLLHVAGTTRQAYYQYHKHRQHYNKRMAFEYIY